MKIYDCFTFFNEIDVLHLRMSELYDAVDYFVIVEANKTHRGQPKGSLFLDNRSKFEAFSDKIRHIFVEDFPDQASPWQLENHQRNGITRGLTDMASEDLCVVSDVDEIIRRDVMQRMRETTAQVLGFRLSLHYFKLNYMATHGPEAHVVWSVAARGGLLGRYTPQNLRDSRLWLHASAFNGTLPDYASVIDAAGWHFSFMGDSAHVVNKLRNYAHFENDTEENIARVDVDALIASGSDMFGRTDFRWTVIRDMDRMPQALRTDPGRYAAHLVP